MMGEENIKNTKPLKYLCICILALVLSLVLQILSGILFSTVMSAVKMFQLEGAGITDLAMMRNEIYDFIMSNSIWSVVLYQVTGILVFGIWYGKVNKGGRPAALTDVFNVRPLIGVIILGLGMEFFVTAGVSAAEFVLPELIGNFEQQMETAGMNDVTLGSMLGSVVMAPIGEELLCRGVIFQYAKKVSGRFVVANCIQALAFGIMHANLVQGIYAFILGYILGILCERFGSLYAPILAHFTVNLSAMLLVPVVLGPVPMSFPVCLLIAVIAAAVGLLGFRVIGRGEPQVL